MYAAVRSEVSFAIDFVEWPPYNGERSYAEVAQRIIAENNIEDGDIEGGSSLGGMIALEIARQKRLKAVVLIGSATSTDEIQSLLALLSPIAAVTPISLVQILVGKYDNIRSNMFAKADVEFIRAMCIYLSKWQGCQGSQARLFRLHGQKDKVIACPDTDCEIVPNAGHILAITHPKECGAFLNSVNHCLITTEQPCPL